jgi:hypothetical protein
MNSSAGVRIRGDFRYHKDVLVNGMVCAGAEAGVPLTGFDARSLPRSWGALRPFSDVEMLLAELRRRGYRLAVHTVDDALQAIDGLLA